MGENRFCDDGFNGWRLIENGKGPPADIDLALKYGVITEEEAAAYREAAKQSAEIKHKRKSAATAQPAPKKPA